jgi:hypothetical protein
MPPDLLPLLTKASFHHAGIDALSKRLPPDPELDEWIDDAIARYDNNAYFLLSVAAVHAARTLNGRHLEPGLMLLGNDEHYGPLLAWRSSGDVPGHVLAAIKNTFVFPKLQSALLEMLVIWHREHENRPLPPEVFSLTRRLFRTYYHPVNTAPHLLCIAALTQEPGLVTVAKAKIESAAVSDFGKWTEISEKTREQLLARWNGSVMDGVPANPPSPTRILASGETMRRAVERIGRNEPCRCGSGKKYKHCCLSRDHERLHHSSTVSGVTREEIMESPELFLTAENFDRYPEPHLFPKLDPCKIKPELLGKFFTRIGFLRHYDYFITSLPLVPWSEEIATAWKDTLFVAASERRTDVVKQLAALRPPEDMHSGEKRHRMAELALAQDNPAEELRLIHDTADNILSNDGDEATLFSSAHTLLCSRHCGVGILVARGAIPLLPAKRAADLYEAILEARDRLNLLPDDPISETLDKLLLKDRPQDHDDKEAAALRKAQRHLEKKVAEVRELKESLARLERDLELRERKEKRIANEPGPAPTPKERKETNELRARLAELKSTLKQTHMERNEFRRDLEQTRAELEQMRAAPSAHPEPEPPDAEESLLRPPEPVSTQPVRLLEFPKKFDAVLHGVPRHIARNTMVTLGQIAGGEPAGFVGARRLNVCEDITRQRIGGDYRLLYRLLPDRVQVVTLINRRDLDRTIKSLI